MAGLDLARMKSRTTSAFDGFTRGQKTMLVVAVVAILGGGWLFMKWSSKPTYAPLFTNLSANDASSITQELSSQGVPYELAAGGAAVMVPQDQVYQLRIDMSAKGLPSSDSPGYELLDQQGLTTSDFRQRVDYQRALEGELTKTIESIDGVTAAAVHLVIPKDQVFATETGTATASVLVSMAPNVSLSAGKVQAIVHLVASSVEGLNADQVTVADQKGRMLAAAGEQGVVNAASDAQSEMTQGFEDDLAASIRTMLLPVTGEGKAVVRVKADLDFDKQSTVTERFPTDTPSAVVKELTNTETYSGNQAGAAGPISATQTSVAASTGSNGSYSKNAAQKDYALTKVTEQFEKAPGAVKKLSVAVLLDSAANVDTTKVQDLVTKAAGLDTAKGDSLTVTSMAFDTSGAEAAKAELEAASKAASQKDVAGLVRTVGTVLLVLVVLFLAWRSARKATVREPIPAALGQIQANLALPKSLTDALVAAQANGMHGGSIGADGTPGLPSGPQQNPVEIERQQTMSQINTLIEQQPEEVAKTLRSWLADRRA